MDIVKACAFWRRHLGPGSIFWPTRRLRCFCACAARCDIWKLFLQDQFKDAVPAHDVKVIRSASTCVRSCTGRHVMVDGSDNLELSAEEGRYYMKKPDLSCARRALVSSAS